LHEWLDTPGAYDGIKQMVGSLEFHNALAKLADHVALDLGDQIFGTQITGQQ
jgi:hypothetical protein